jgi:hypothetical protein
MIKQLIEISTMLDDKGLASEADSLDCLIEKLANQDYHFGFNPDEMADFLEPKQTEGALPVEAGAATREEKISNAILGIRESIDSTLEQKASLEGLLLYVYEQIRPFLKEEIS